MSYWLKLCGLYRSSCSCWGMHRVTLGTLLAFNVITVHSYTCAALCGGAARLAAQAGQGLSSSSGGSSRSRPLAALLCHTTASSEAAAQATAELAGDRRQQADVSTCTSHCKTKNALSSVSVEHGSARKHCQSIRVQLTYVAPARRQHEQHLHACGSSHFWKSGGNEWQRHLLV